MSTEERSIRVKGFMRRSEGAASVLQLVSA